MKDNKWHWMFWCDHIGGWVAQDTRGQIFCMEPGKTWARLEGMEAPSIRQEASKSELPDWTLARKSLNPVDARMVDTLDRQIKDNDMKNTMELTRKDVDQAIRNYVQLVTGDVAWQKGVVSLRKMGDDIVHAIEINTDAHLKKGNPQR
jgi:hypothetical protein